MTVHWRINSKPNCAAVALALVIILSCYAWATTTFATAFVTSVTNASNNNFPCSAICYDSLSSSRPAMIENDSDENNAIVTKSSHSPTYCRRHFFRTTFFTTTSSLLIGIVPNSATAGIDPSTLKALPIEGDASGSNTRLRQLSSMSRNNNGPRPEDSKDIAFSVLPSGEGSYRTYREGSGDATIQPGSRVAVEMTIRCRSFATAEEPGGLTYFTTRGDTDFNELAWTIISSTAEVPVQLEECMMGMRRGSLRRIELPSPVVYSAYKAGKLPLPSEKNKDGKRRFDNLWKTDATLLFEVLVTRIK